MKLAASRHRAQLYRDMLPTSDQVNDRKDGFTREDMDILLAATDQMVPLDIEDIRLRMAVHLRVYYRHYIDALTGRRKGEVERTDEIVAALTRGWEEYRIHMPDPDVKGAAPLQDWVEGLLGKDGVRRIEPKVDR